MDRDIRIGIPTEGRPVLERRGENTLLRNMLIGKDFHWQKSIEALLPGKIELHDNQEYPVINVVPLEIYLECVVGSEMNPEAPSEFLKAHAVISRSWALGKIINIHNHSEDGKIFSENRIISWEDTCDHIGFDVCSDDHCQRYQGLQPIPTATAEAIRETAREVLLTGNVKILDARFSKCCGGRTELFSSCWQNSEEECLESIEDPWCDLSSLHPNTRDRLLRSILKEYDVENGGGYRWKTTVTAEEVRMNLKQKFGRDIGIIQDMRITEIGISGRATQLRLSGSENELTIGKELMIRRLLAPTHLYSSRIHLRKNLSATTISEWIIDGKGWGHGVGLCQIGAARMALEGFGYKEILRFYYPGSEIGQYH